jgi:hypothetical protein
MDSLYKPAKSNSDEVEQNPDQALLMNVTQNMPLKFAPFGEFWQVCEDISQNFAAAALSFFGFKRLR